MDSRGRFLLEVSSDRQLAGESFGTKRNSIRALVVEKTPGIQKTDIRHWTKYKPLYRNFFEIDTGKTVYVKKVQDSRSEKSEKPSEKIFICSNVLFH